MIPKGFLIAIAIAVLYVSVYSIWKGGYETALDDVRNGNVQVNVQRY